MQRAQDVPASYANRKFLSIKVKKSVLDLLVKWKLVPSQVLTSIIFKTLPDEATIDRLKKDGYRLVGIPENPYVKEN